MTITVFGLLAALSLAVLLAGTGIWCRRKGVDAGAWLTLCVITIPLAFVMSRVLFSLFALVNADFTLPVQSLYFWDGGASLMGAFGGALIAVVITGRITGASRAVMLDGMAMAAPLALVVERLSEPLAELGVGRIVDTEFLAFLGAAFEDRHPVFIYETVAALVIFAVLLVYCRNARRRPGDLMLTFLTLFGSIQMLLESLQDDAHMVIYFIRINQIAALIMVLAAFVVWTVRWVRAGAKALPVVMACVVLVAGVALGIMQEFAVDSNPNLLLEYAIMALSLAVVGGVTLFVRGRANRTA